MSASKKPKLLNITASAQRIFGDIVAYAEQRHEYARHIDVPGDADTIDLKYGEVTLWFRNGKRVQISVSEWGSITAAPETKEEKS